MRPLEMLAHFIIIFADLLPADCVTHPFNFSVQRGMLQREGGRHRAVRVPRRSGGAANDGVGRAGGGGNSSARKQILKSHSITVDSDQRGFAESEVYVRWSVLIFAAAAYCAGRLLRGRLRRGDLNLQVVTNEPQSDESQLRQRALQMRAPMMLLTLACMIFLHLIIGTFLNLSNLFYIGIKGPSLVVLREEVWFWYASEIWISALLAPLLVNPIAGLFQSSKPPLTFSDCMFLGPARGRRYAWLAALVVFGAISIFDVRIHARLTDTAVIDDWLWGAKVHPYSQVSDVAIGPYRVTSGGRYGGGRYYYATGVFVTFKDGSIWSPQRAYSDIGKSLTYKIAGLVSKHSGVQIRYSDPDKLLGEPKTGT
jgi:hypothetical protein